MIKLGLTTDRKQAFALVTEGRVFVNGQKAVSPAQLVAADDRIEMRKEPSRVGRGGVKLEAALGHFGVAIAGTVCADIGAATGGFTEALLAHGAARVYAIDTGRGKLAEKLRRDPRVVVMEKTNVLALGDAFGKRLQAPARPAALAKAPRSSRFQRDTMPADGAFRSAKAPSVSTRRLERSQRHPPSADGGEEIDLVAIDVSFTSLRAVLPIVRGWLSKAGSVIALFKPQYELKDKMKLQHGIVRDDATRHALITDFRAWLTAHGWRERGMMESPIRGSEGNVEYLFYLSL